MHVYVYTLRCVCSHRSICACMSVCLSVCLYACTYVCTIICICARVNLYYRFRFSCHRNSVLPITLAPNQCGPRVGARKVEHGHPPNPNQVKRETQHKPSYIMFMFQFFEVCSTAQRANMEPEKGPFDDYRPPSRASPQVPC